MSKEITEKWKAGKLKQAFYYLKFPDTDISEIYTLYDMEKFRYVKDSDKIEVLAPVPSYDEYKELVSKTDKLEKKLVIATKALKEYSVSDNWFMEDSEGKCWSFNKQYPWRIGFKALKEMEGVK